MLSYVIVGSGYRAEYFGRIAHTYPELFRAMFLCRSEEKVRLMKAHTGAEATMSAEACMAFRPDFAVIAVDRGHMAEEAEKWIRRGIPVVTETPVGDTEESLRRLWEMGQAGARIVCCEQYFRQGVLAEGLRAIEEGLIGEPSSLYISLLHDYHAFSMIRRALGIPAGEGYTLRGLRQHTHVTASDSRYGAIYDGSMAEGDRDMVLVSFDSGKEAIYDFCPVQYRSFIRSRHLTVRGSRGEWTDTAVLYLDENNEPRERMLNARIPEKYRRLDTQALRDRRRNLLPALAPDTVQDEYAIATILLDMEEYLAGGPSPYPLEEALEDAYFWLRLNEAVERRGEPVRAGERPWKREE